MTTVVPLKAGAFAAIYEQRIIIGIQRALPVLLEALKDLTPEDTQEMLNSYRVDTVKKDGGNIVGVITNDVDYAIHVEYGASGLRYGYHKPKGSLFYVGQGNMTFHRAVDNSREKITQIIFNEINR